LLWQPSATNAAFGAVLLALGPLLRVRTAEVILGVAVVGGIVAARIGARGWLLLVFWVLGLAIALLRPFVVQIARRLAQRRFLTVERTKAARLGPEN
jgi:hypothetical protein